jgi:MarR family transcriptional regulator, organic hydroperoxide resistance regulator
MPKITFFDESYNLWLQLFQTRSALFKARQNKVGKYIHYNMAAALVTIWAFDGKATPAVLSRRLFLEPHTTSELVKRMEQKGLIKKTKDGKRENIIRISITEKGRKLCVYAIQPDFVHSIVDILSDEQKKQLTVILRILYIQALKELGLNEDDMRP